MKIWSGREDNEWLAEIGATMEASSESFPTDLYAKLSQGYKSHCGERSK